MNIVSLKFDEGSNVTSYFIIRIVFILREFSFVISEKEIYLTYLHIGELQLHTKRH